VPSEDYTRLAIEIAPAFTSWPGLLVTVCEYDLLDAPTTITAPMAVAR
jgi:hypothetical protein